MYTPTWSVQKLVRPQIWFDADNYSCLKLANPTRDAILMGDVQET